MPDNLPPEALYYTRTDGEGRMRSVTAGYAALCQTAAEDLIGAPHHVTHGPGMPRGILKLLNQHAMAGQPFAGYFPNLGDVWLFAVVTPVPGGFAAVRFVPQGRLLAQVAPFYERVVARAGDDDLAIRAGLRAMGFDSYDAFMTYALSHEVRARSRLLGQRSTPGLRRLRALYDLTRSLETQAKALEDVFRGTEQIPYNMRLQARRLQGSDSAFSVISDNHRQMSAGVGATLRTFQNNAVLGADGVARAAFEVAAAGLVREMHGLLAHEAPVLCSHPDEDRQLLADLADRYVADANTSVQGLARGARGLSVQCKDMRRVAAGLEMTRIMCVIERSRSSGDAEGLDEIVSRLMQAEEALRAALSDIERDVQRIGHLSETLLRLNTSAVQAA
ncbi:MAG: hypothetical protein AAF218_04235 [Pseudomonadota bacterium]